ncbi:hypothetical protein BB559_002352 [Furculomyces boomerangus]|uniref:ABC transporter domain-containing protein n=1 Tax=Furculomyces boomerangus TaxID=61424 RepID=A0A2T9YVW7_9FUNG|nr:hypothetical protein BB559_002352 [Furculomyces boomerangus]
MVSKTNSQMISEKGNGSKVTSNSPSLKTKELTSPEVSVDHQKISSKPTNPFERFFHKSKKTEKKDKTIVSIQQLYAFANTKEKILLAIGIFFAVISGLTMPFNTIFFSRLTGSFVEYNALITQGEKEEARNLLKDKASKNSLILVWFFISMFFTTYIQNTIFALVAEKQILRIKDSYYKSVLSQNMAWFDTVSTGDLTNKIFSDISIIHEGTGVRMGYLVQNCFTFIGGYTIALIKGYKMALVVIPTVPIIPVIAKLMGFNVGFLSKQIQTCYSESNSIADETLSSISTVMAFNGQSHELNRFDKKNALAGAVEIRKARALGLGLSSISFVVYATYSLCLWFGAKLIRDGQLTPENVLNVFFAFYVGGAGISSMTPNISSVMSARGAAATVFEIINRKSPIDPLDTESGIKVDGFKGEIEIQNVSFSYPTRTEVKALKNFSIKIKPGEKVALVGGSVIESGTHSELYNLGGAYTALVNAQNIKEDNTDFDDYKTTNVPILKTLTANQNTSSVQTDDYSVDISKEEEKPKTPISPRKSSIISLLSLYFKVFLRTYFFRKSCEKLSRKLRYELFESLLNQDMEYFDKNPVKTGALTLRISSEPEKIFLFGTDSFPMLITAATSVISGISIAFSKDWRLTLIILCVFPIMMICEGQQTRIMTVKAKESKENTESGAKDASETISNIRTVTTFGLEPAFTKKYHKNNLDIYKKSIKGCYTGGAYYGFSQSSGFLMYSFSFYMGSVFILKGYLNSTEMLNTLYAIVFASIALGQASQFMGYLPKALASLSVINQSLQDIPKINVRDNSGESPDRIVGTVNTKDAEFTYPSRPDVKILKGVSLEAKPGQTVALVGSSGSGKSTIINLILRLYDVENGSVNVEDIDVRKWKLSELRNHPSLVSQEPVLFDYSASENIRYGRPDATQFEVEQAAKAANIHDMLMDMPDGYETRVGGNRSQLSGGQKQRIAIARALLRNPRLLLLDEATSALDTESEKIVQEALDKASEGRTTISIAHRLSTIQNADWIYVFDSGKIVEQGTHSSLIQQQGVYYSLVKQQSLMD